MANFMSIDHVRFVLRQFRTRLWVRPLAVCLFSVMVAFIAKLADDTRLTDVVPLIDKESIETLLSIMAASMLVIATFAVAAMVSAYASASSTATPRTFTLMVADDVSQNALSTFVGAFIFSIIALTSVKNDYFESAGLFLLFLLTWLIFGVVILMFVRWVDSIARLGRLGSTIDKVEQATAQALMRRRQAPTLCAMSAQPEKVGQPVFSSSVGYVQHLDVAALNKWAEANGVRVRVTALPGTFMTPDRPLAYVSGVQQGPNPQGIQAPLDCTPVSNAFQVGGDRVFDEDPRFGFVVLSEIAGRALSPAVNDPGTAIDIIGTLLRLFALWGAPVEPGDEPPEPRYLNVDVPALSAQDMFEDAFTAISRDGAGVVEVSIRLQKALHALAAFGDTSISNAAKHYSSLALKRAEQALVLEEDLAAVQSAAKFIESVKA